MSCVIFENDPQMNAGCFFFVLGCGKKIPASLATEGTMAALAAVGKP